MFRIHCQERTVGRRIRARRTFRRSALIGVLSAAAALTSAGSALAVSGTRVHVAELSSHGAPAVAVGPEGTAYVAWANNIRQPKEGDLIETCVIPTGATGCKYHSSLRLEGGAEPYVSKVEVLVDGKTVVLLATGTFGVATEKYTPVQEWQSNNGGETFTIVDNGLSVSNYAGPIANAVIVPGTDALGIGAGEPSFDEFPFEKPGECSEASCPASKFATLQSPTEKTAHELVDFHGVFASDLASGQQGVLGVFQTTSRQTQCNGTGSSVTDFVYGHGEQKAGNSYDTKPGPGSAWKELSPGGCEVGDVAVAGGPSGLGVVENDQTRGYTVYQRFNQSTEEFENAYSTISTEGENEPSLSQDEHGNLYLTYETFYGVNVAYSSNGGTSWVGPAQMVAEQYGVGELSSAAGANGQGWAVWTREESIYAQQFNASDAVPPVVAPVSTPTHPTSPPPPATAPSPNSTYTVKSVVVNLNGTVTITFVPTQSGEATLVLTVPTASIAKTSATAAKAKKCKHGQIKLKGKCVPSTTTAGKVTANGTAGVPLKLKVNLSSAIKALLKKGKTVHLTAKLTYRSSLGGNATVHTYSVTIKGHKSKKK